MNYVTKLADVNCKSCIWNDPCRDGDQCRHATGLIYEPTSYCSNGNWLFEIPGEPYMANVMPQKLVDIYVLLRTKDRMDREAEERKEGGNVD